MAESPKFTDENGNFVSSYQREQVGYIVELMEWVYEHNNMTYEEKMQNLLNLEGIHDSQLKTLFPEGNYSFERLSDKLKAAEKGFCECEKNSPYKGIQFDFKLRCAVCNKIIRQ